MFEDKILQTHYQTLVPSRVSFRTPEKGEGRGGEGRGGEGRGGEGRGGGEGVRDGADEGSKSARRESK